MAFPPPPGPFGGGGSGFPPPGFPPPGGGSPFGGGIVVHRARLLPRLLLVGGLMAVSFLVTGAVIWFAFLGAADDVGRAARAGTTTVTSPGGGAGDPSAIAVPAGWPAALTPPEGAAIVTSVASSAGTPEEQLVMVVEISGEAPAVAEDLRAQLATAGIVVTGDAVGPTGVGSLTGSGAGWEASVSMSPNPARPGVVTVSWVLRRGPR